MPLELTVGGLEGASYFATSNQLKGDVFLVGKELFEEGARGPSYFQEVIVADGSGCNLV